MTLKKGLPEDKEGVGWRRLHFVLMLLVILVVLVSIVVFIIMICNFDPH